MTLQIPSYLRIHSEASTSSRKFAANDDLDKFWRAYVEATGWRIDKTHASKTGAKLLPALDCAIDDVESMEDKPAVSKQAAEDLATAAAQIEKRLRELESAHWREEAEQAVEDIRTAGVNTGDHIADRLEQVMHEVATAAGCDAAGLYLLDDDTSVLNLRSCYGLPKSKLSDPPRALRGALGDLEALVSSVVTIDDIASMTHWHSPEDRGAAIVVAVRGGDLPLGTLWLWDSAPRDFTPAEQAAAKLAAGRIAAELELEIVKKSNVQEKVHKKDMREAAAWQARQLPPSVPLAHGWDAAGWADSVQSIGGDWYTWDILPDGTIALAIGGTELSGTEAALTASTVRSAWQSHVGYRHNVSQLLGRVNDTLWQTSTGEQLANILYANLDPDTGEGDFATAGSCHALVVNDRGFRPVNSPSSPLGSDPDQSPEKQSLRLLPGDALVVVTDGIVCSNASPDPARLTQEQLASIVRDHLSDGPEEAMAALRRRIAQLGTPANDRAITILNRQL